jgi:prepilin peptidase CpaA
MPNFVDFWVNAVVLVLAACIDVRTRRIPNWLSLPFAVSGILFRFVTAGASGLLSGLEGAALALLLFGWIWALKGMGMGDLKLVAGVGAWVGPGQFFMAFVMTGIAGGIMAICYALRRGSLAKSLDNMGDLLIHLGSCKRRPHNEIRLGGSKALSIPYAPAIAVGTLFSFLTR